MAAATAGRRLKSVGDHISPPSTLVLVLPDDARVTLVPSSTAGDPQKLCIDGKPILEYTVEEGKSYAYDLSSYGTPMQGKTTHVPRYNLVQVNPPANSTSCTIPDFWAAVYALFTLYHEQEYIPINISTLGNHQDLAEYLVSTGLGRLYPSKTPRPQGPPRTHNPEEPIFLSRSAFWQGAGTQGYHDRSWLRHPRPVFPTISSFTRAENVVAKHPQRPPKPFPGQVLYRRWCATVGQMLELTYFDVDGVSDSPSSSSSSSSPSSPSSSSPSSDRGLSKHMAAFHKWHNDPRVNSAWGEQGSLSAHRAYIQNWDGELMGYVEVVYTKEDHSAVYFPFGDQPGEWDRGIHVLVGEERFLGGGRSEIWLRSLVHYIFLEDPRSDRVVGEPDAGNTAIRKAAESAGFHNTLVFDFPYKRSALVVNPRDKFFTLCRLH
ncbi:acyl-CoA N-acyltransferase [Coprinopsis sp. MPI-PUGE-AT-0042]|nr:acyl-CoA N-acyltransferase [Coprinopsis sp. MPI-PUGE-AT-0042]